MNWSEFLLFLLNWDWFDLIRAIYSSVSCPNFCCHSCTTLIKVAWIRVGKISKHEVYNMKELRKSKKWHETLKCSNQFKKTQNQLKQIESWSGYFFLPTKPCLAPSESSGIMLLLYVQVKPSPEPDLTQTYNKFQILQIGLLTFMNSPHISAILVHRKSPFI